VFDEKMPGRIETAEAQEPNKSSLLSSRPISQRKGEGVRRKNPNNGGGEGKGR